MKTEPDCTLKTGGCFGLLICFQESLTLKHLVYIIYIYDPTKEDIVSNSFQFKKQLKWKLTAVTLNIIFINDGINYRRVQKCHLMTSACQIVVPQFEVIYCSFANMQQNKLDLRWYLKGFFLNKKYLLEHMFSQRSNLGFGERNKQQVVKPPRLINNPKAT